MFLRENKDKINNIEIYTTVEKELDMIEDLVFRISEQELSEYSKFRIFKGIEKIKNNIKNIKFK